MGYFWINFSCIFNSIFRIFRYRTFSFKIIFCTAIMLLETKNISNSINIVVFKFCCTIGKWFWLFCGVLLYNWQMFQLGNSVVCKISRENVNCYYKKYFSWLKLYILFPNLAPALINERSDGDSLDGERARIPLQQTLIREQH